MTNAPISLQDPRRSLYISRRRLNQPVASGGCTSMSASGKRCTRPIRWREQQRGSGNRRGHVRSHRRRGSGGLSATDTGETGQQHVSANAGAEEGDSQGRGQQSPRAFDSDHPRPRGPGGTEANTGADLRDRFPTGIVWLPAETASA